MGNVFFWISKDICTKDNSDFSQKKSIVLFYFIWWGEMAGNLDFWPPGDLWEGSKVNFMFPAHVGRDKSGPN